MERLALTLFVEHPSDMESAVSFFQMIQPFDILLRDERILRLSGDFYQSEDFEGLHQRLTEELLIASKAYVAPLHPLLDLTLADPVVKSMSFGFHTFPEVIAEAALKARGALFSSFKRFLFHVVNDELLRTVLSFLDADLNQSKAAKALYMHRNTLLYRIDQFAQLTGIDPRRFEGAFALKLLTR
jgi:DNA-binding PucR family transcriptional regulator